MSPDLPTQPSPRESPDAPLDTILNFHRINERILTAGQPTEEQMPAVAAAGVRTVINLALATSTGALPDERATVEALGMCYLALPVRFEAPTTEDWDKFCEAMDARPNETLLVHCAMNYRVSSFMAIYGMRRWGWTPTDALTEIRRFWEPDAAWTVFLAANGVR